VEGHLHQPHRQTMTDLREAAGESKAVTRPPVGPSTSPARAAAPAAPPGADCCLGPVQEQEDCHDPEKLADDAVQEGGGVGL
jgi:hypothetical protein